MKNLKLYFKIIILIICSFYFFKKYLLTMDNRRGLRQDIEGRPQVSVVDGSTAFITGGEVVNATYKTTNGGRNWIQLNTSSFNIFWSIWAKDANTVFAGANGNAIRIQ